jgi:multidrug efflux system membrane fusion protein
VDLDQRNAYRNRYLNHFDRFRSASVIPNSLICVLMAVAIALPPLAGETPVNRRAVDDRKAVIATVEPVHELVARARIDRTITSLAVKEGDWAHAEDRIAVVVDQKLLLQMRALDSRIEAQQAQRDQAQTNFGRAQELRSREVTSQSQLDQARTTLEVAERTLQALHSDRRVIEQQAAEGAVLAPDAGRVLKVPVQAGSVVLPGETIAAIAVNNYILRLQLPERHARSLNAGNTVLVGARGLDAPDEETLHPGKVVLVYPKIDNGRVIADVSVEGLGDYFVGERTRVYVARPASGAGYPRDQRPSAVWRQLCEAQRRHRGHDPGRFAG